MMCALQPATRAQVNIEVNMCAGTSAKSSTTADQNSTFVARTRSGRRACSSWPFRCQPPCLRCLAGRGLTAGGGRVGGDVVRGVQTPCGYCGHPVEQPGGQRRLLRYCDRSCRQRAYELRARRRRPAGCARQVTEAMDWSASKVMRIERRPSSTERSTASLGCHPKNDGADGRDGARTGRGRSTPPGSRMICLCATRLPAGCRAPQFPWHSSLPRQ